MALAGAPVTYRGFISYSHRDATFARRLHRQLESYRLPSKLVGSETARGIVPDRLSPIFRDREELSAGESLSDQVLAALAASEALIIICSPNAKASLWVGKEIENFRMLHPDRPVLAALIDGEPDEAFPAALLSAPPATASPSPLVGEGWGEGHPLPQGEKDGATREPIAADFRKGKDGHRLARLKLAAGLTGVPLDALVQRDAQRQFRRVMAVTIAAGIALLVMAGLLVMALQARKEADRQRQEAEGLVEYMLTDLRDKLRGVGRLDVMTAVNERAMSYYGGQQALEGLPPESLDRRARILHAMGEDDEKRGDLGTALAKFKEAHRTTAAVLALKPDDADAIFAHAQSEYWVGYIGWRQLEYSRAAQHWRAYLKLAEDLSKAEPNTARSNMEVGYALGNLCELNMRKENTMKIAMEYCTASIPPIRQAVHIAPNNVTYKMDLANRIGWLADAFGKLGRNDDAIEQRKLEGATLADIARSDPMNVELQIRQTWPQIGIAKAEAGRGNILLSASVFSGVIMKLKELERRNPTDLRPLEYQVRSNLEVARAFRTVERADWKRYRDDAETPLLKIERLGKPDALLRASAMLERFDRENE